MFQRYRGFMINLIRDFNHWARRVFEDKLAEQQQKALEEGTEGVESSMSIDEWFQTWRDKMEEESIPRQLQKLFVRLLKSDKRAESTGVISKFQKVLANLFLEPYEEFWMAQSGVFHST